MDSDLTRCQLTCRAWSRHIERNSTTLPIYRFHQLELGSNEYEEETDNDNDEAETDAQPSWKRARKGCPKKPTREPYRTSCPGGSGCEWETIISNIAYRLDRVESDDRRSERQYKRTVDLRLVMSAETPKMVTATFPPEGRGKAKAGELHNLIHFLADATHPAIAYLYTVKIYSNFSPELLYLVCLTKAGMRCDQLYLYPANWYCPLGLKRTSSNTLIYSLLNQPLDGWKRPTGGIWANDVMANFRCLEEAYEAVPIGDMLLRGGHFCRRRLKIKWDGDTIFRENNYQLEWQDAVMFSSREALMEMSEQSALIDAYANFDIGKATERYTAEGWQRFRIKLSPNQKMTTELRWKHEMNNNYYQFRLTYNDLTVRLMTEERIRSEWIAQRRKKMGDIQGSTAIMGDREELAVTGNRIPQDDDENHFPYSIVFIRPLPDAANAAIFDTVALE